MDSMQRILAKKYASAYMNVFGSSLTSKKIEQIERFVQFLEQHKKVLFYLQLALIDDSLKKESLIALVRKFDLDVSFEKLFDLLLFQKRLFLMPEVLCFIVQFFHEQLHRLIFRAESSHELSSAQLAELKKFLVSQTGKKITLLPRIDKTLIVGIRLVNPTFEWEHSIRKQLRTLSYLR